MPQCDSLSLTTPSLGRRDGAASSGRTPLAASPSRPTLLTLAAKTCRRNAGRLFWLELHPISPQLIHMLIGLPPPQVCVQFQITPPYYAGQRITVIQVTLALANWREESPVTACRYNAGVQWGASEASWAPPSAFPHLRGFRSTPFCLQRIKNIYVSC